MSATPEANRKTESDLLFSLHNAQWLHQLVEILPGGILVLAMDGSVVFANGEADRMLGLSRAEVLNLNQQSFHYPCYCEDGRLITPDDLPGARCLRTAEPQPPRTFCMHRPDGQVIWGVFAAMPLWAGLPPKLSGVLVTGFDITQHKMQEAQLRRSEEFHHLISDLTCDYAYSFRVEADGRFVMDGVTNGLLQFTGYSATELDDRGWVRLIDSEDIPRTLMNTPKLLQGAKVVDEIRIRTKAGEPRWIRYSSVPFWDPVQQRVTRFVGAVQNITERKQAEQKHLDSTQRLQTLSRRLLEVQELERRYLARELRDEIGQLLTGLRLQLDMCFRLPPENRRRSLDQACKTVQELTSRVRDLSMRLRPSMLDDLGLLAALNWLMERFTAQTQIQVAFQPIDLDRRFTAPVETAAYRIVQEALTNVARHAGVQQVAVRLWLDRDNLCLEVEDHGKGFDVPAARASPHSSGLSGMEERAVLLGGRLRIASRPQAGTRVSAELPLLNLQENFAHAPNLVTGRRS